MTITMTMAMTMAMSQTHGKESAELSWIRSLANCRRLCHGRIRINKYNALVREKRTLWSAPACSCINKFQYSRRMRPPVWYGFLSFSGFGTRISLWSWDPNNNCQKCWISQRRDSYLLIRKTPIHWTANKWPYKIHTFKKNIVIVLVNVIVN